MAPALGYGRAKELSQAMVTPLSPVTFSYIAPSGEKHIGKVEEKHFHTVYMELPFSPLISGGMVRKEFVETEMPPNGDVP
ncbi:hypothetical protein I302_103400 [Kwoniella bestiolae CBS 10118]|uniref:Uncharacterized protein n=1 Tax=Kwoniella bestiolae CBS 10118 TaxID=1296100 RepID=A0A1B9G8E7_9TREE|nr:hypothetical protein I302_02100 [Kwoniella bestiolae CBS 10118]OCF27260.1 hypothetical protein I302_02100 [Kwoniella bestiolae CBS 10118]